jgi:hypothetical protein
MCGLALKIVRMPRKSYTTWKSSLITMELYFPVSFDIQFCDDEACGYSIEFTPVGIRNNNRQCGDNLVLSLN